MADSVQEMLDNGGVYVVEAPVGCGKTFAYLTPALLATGRRIVVATAKKALQDQIEEKDLPAIAELLGVTDRLPHALKEGPQGALSYLSQVVKGKSNYTCQVAAAKFNPPAQYYSWLAQSAYGDRADYPGGVPIWWGGATAEDCMGSSCEAYGKCGFIKLKQRVAQSRAVIANHHLLGADMYYGPGKMVGGAYDILIVDEAHKLIDGIRSAFTVTVAESTADDLIKKLASTPFTLTRARALAPVWAEMFSGLPASDANASMLCDTPVFDRKDADNVLTHLRALYNELYGLLALYCPETRALSVMELIMAALQGQTDSDLRNDLNTVGSCLRLVENCADAIRVMQAVPVEQRPGESEEDWEARNARIRGNTAVSRRQDSRGNVQFTAAPIRVGPIARAYFSQIKTVILASATLAVDEEFEHYVNDVVGAPPAKTEILPSTFNYPKQGFAFIPRDTPVVNRFDPTYGLIMRKKIEYCEELINLSRGGAFILTTSNEELDILAQALKPRLPYPVFVQGHSNNPWDGDAQVVKTKFLAETDAVLIGAKSFWEGIDIPGERLRLVIITKLPFPYQSDPMILARTNMYGGSAKGWRHVSYVDMMIELRQGVGRLIRASTDRGVIALLDSRVWDKKYGAGVRAALKFPVTTSIEDCRRDVPRVVEYYRRLKKAAG